MNDDLFIGGMALFLLAVATIIFAAAFYNLLVFLG